ncbi:MAG: hypothetical protein DAHOPDDO_01273 [Ignavibacteriaceae bacterium]|nr:hypothetical protein [Ignavibacteriaceae bacterium]
MDYLIKVRAAKYLGGYKVYYIFSNGEEKIVDLKDELEGEMFEPLKDKNIFMQFRVDDILKTIVWSNGADIAPYSLFEMGKPVKEKIIKSQRLKSGSKVKIKP